MSTTPYATASSDANQTTSPPPRKGRSRRKKGTTQPASGPRSNDMDSGKQSTGSSGSSEGNRALEGAGLGLSGRFEQVHSAPKTEGYFRLVDACFDELISVKPEIRRVITRSEWTHVHALLLYARVSNVQYSATGWRAPPPVRIPLPYNVRVFQPIWAILSDIGVVEDSERRVRYIPVACLPTTDDLSSDNELIEIASCTMFDWVTSWNSVLADRAVLQTANDRDGHLARTPAEEPQAWTLANLTLLHDILADLKSISELADDGAVLDFNGKVMVSDGTNCSVTIAGTLKTVTTRAEAALLRDEVVRGVKQDKARRIADRHPAVSNTVTQFQWQDEQVPNDPGNYGSRLRWDPALWSALQKVCEIVSPISMWSPSFPKEPIGTYMWLLPRYSSPQGFFVTLPTVKIPTPVWVLALILDMSTLTPQSIHTFYVQSDSTPSFSVVRKAYISASIKSGTPVETFR